MTSSTVAKPKLCINANCSNIIYVPAYKLHMCIQCQDCMDKRELSLAIADNGRWEEFHQKRGNFTMYDHHKGLRLKLEREYRARFGS